MTNALNIQGMSSQNLHAYTVKVLDDTVAKIQAIPGLEDMDKGDIRIFLQAKKQAVKFCLRCGGEGRSVKWKLTGETCYSCGGTGNIRPADYDPIVRRAQRNAEKFKAEVSQVIEEEKAIQKHLDDTKEERENQRKANEENRVNAEKAWQQIVQKHNAFILNSFPSGSFSQFISDMSYSLKNNFAVSLSDRQLEIIGGIYSKDFGRKGSKNYNAAFDEFYEKINKQQEFVDKHKVLSDRHQFVDALLRKEIKAEDYL